MTNFQTIKNRLKHPVTIPSTGKDLSPGATGTADLDVEDDLALLTDGTVSLVGDAGAIIPELFKNYPGRVFVSDTEPAGWIPSDLWWDESSGELKRKDPDGSTSVRLSVVSGDDDLPPSAGQIVALDDKTGKARGLRPKKEIALRGEDLFIAAADFQPVATASSTPSLVQVAGDTSRNAWLAWAMDATLRESIAVTRLLPDAWGTELCYIDVVLGWVNPNASTGNVRWQFDRSSLYPSTSITTDDTHDREMTAVAGSQYVLKEDVIASGVPVYPDHIHRFEVRRYAEHGADTLANDADILYLRIQKSRLPVTTSWTRS